MIASSTSPRMPNFIKFGLVNASLQCGKIYISYAILFSYLGDMWRACAENKTNKPIFSTSGILVSNVSYSCIPVRL